MPFCVPCLPLPFRLRFFFFFPRRPGPERFTHIGHSRDPPDDIRQRGVAMFPVSTSVISIVTRTSTSCSEGSGARRNSADQPVKHRRRPANDVIRERLSDIDKCNTSASSVQITIVGQRYRLNCAKIGEHGSTPWLGFWETGPRVLE